MTTPACLTGYPGHSLRHALWSHYSALLRDVTPSDGVLVLTPASTAWRRLFEQERPVTGARRLHSPQAWVQQMLRLWWPVVERRLVALGFTPATSGVSAGPAFVAVDLAQHLMQRFTLPLMEPETGALVRGAHSVPRMQLMQVLDALGRGIEQGAELNERPESGDIRGAILPWLESVELHPADAALALAARVVAPLDAAQLPGFAPQMGAALAVYTDAMLRWRVFDHALQLAAFHDLLWPDPAFQAHFKLNTRHVLVEDLDELPSRWQHWIQEAMDGGVNARLVLKSDPGAQAGGYAFRGGLREYVGAHTAGAWQLASRLDVVPTASQAPPLADLGRALADGLMERPRVADVDRARVKLRLDAYAVPEMLDAVVRDLADVLMDGTPPDEVALVAPTLGPMLIWALRGRLEQLGLPLYVFKGTTMLTDYRAVRLLLTLARLCRPRWGAVPSRFELLELLEIVTGENPLKLGRLLPQLAIEGVLVAPDALPAGLSEDAARRYTHIWGFVARHAEEPIDADLEEFFRDAFTEVWAPFQSPSTLDPARESAEREVSQIGQLIELAGRFRDLDARIEADGTDRGRRFLAFLQSQPIAERPFFEREPHAGAIMLATASQLAERAFSEPAERLRHLFVLDAGSTRWWKSDRRELTNVRIFAPGRAPGPYERDEEFRDETEKLARVLMACCLKVEPGGTLWVHGSLTDEEGQENLGDLPHLLGMALGLAHTGREA